MTAIQRVLVCVLLLGQLLVQGGLSIKVWKLNRHRTKTFRSNTAALAAACRNAVKCDFVYVSATIESGLATTTLLCPVTNRRSFPCDGTLVVPLSPDAVVIDCKILVSATVLVGKVVPSMGYQSSSSFKMDRKSRFAVPNFYGVRSAVSHITIGPHQTVIFNLTYQEVLPPLQRNFYKYVVEFDKSKVNGHITSKITIVDRRRILRTHVPMMRAEAKATAADELLEEQLDPNTVIRSSNANGYSTVRVKYNSQGEAHGPAGQLVVLFQVEVPTGGHDLQVQNGYFLFTFVPFYLTALKRHLILILDKTGYIPELKQLKMEKFVSRTLSALHQTDHFNVLVNSDDVHRWRSTSANAEHRHARDALRFIQCTPANGQNSLDKAFVEAFKIIERTGKKPMYHTILVLTNEETSFCEQELSRRSSELKRTVNLKENCQVLSVGYEYEDHVDWLRQLSMTASGLVTSVHDFDTGLLSPLLYNVQLKLPTDKVDLNTVVNSSDKIFVGREYVAIGKLIDTREPLETIEVSGKTRKGEHFRTVLSAKLRERHKTRLRTGATLSGDILERLWSHLYVSNMMRKRFMNKMDHIVDEDLENRAVKFCVKHNYVTELTKMVFDTPNSRIGLELLVQENIPIRQLRKELDDLSSSSLQWPNDSIHHPQSQGGQKLSKSKHSKSSVCDGLYAENQKKALKQTACKRNHTLMVSYNVVEDRKLVSKLSRNLRSVLTAVEESERTGKCGKNEHFTDCGPASSSCQVTCGNYEKPPRCPMVCGPGMCVCNVGYVRGPEGQCIKSEKCQAAINATTKCKDNEEFKKCGLPRSECETTCHNMHEPPVCIEICGFEGCFCKDGFVRNKNWDCVNPMECAKDTNKSGFCERRFLDNGCNVCECNDQAEDCPASSLCFMHCPYDVLKGECHFCNCSKRDYKEIYWVQQNVTGTKNQTVCFDLQVSPNQTYVLYSFAGTGVIVTGTFRTVRRNFRRWVTFEKLKIQRNNDYVLIENDQVSVNGFSNETLKLFDEGRREKFSRMELSLEGKKIAEIQRRKLDTCECGPATTIWLLDVKAHEASDGLMRQLEKLAAALQVEPDNAAAIDNAPQGMEVKMTIPQAHFSNLEVSDEQLMIGSRLVRRKDWMHGDIVHCYQISLSLLKPLLDTGRFVVRS